MGISFAHSGNESSAGDRARADGRHGWTWSERRVHRLPSRVPGSSRHGFDFEEFTEEEIKAGEKIKKVWDSIKEDKVLAQESRIFIDEHPLFESICIASGITPIEGRKKFYKRVNDKINKKIEKRKKTRGKKKNKES